MAFYKIFALKYDAEAYSNIAKYDIFTLYLIYLSLQANYFTRLVTKSDSHRATFVHLKEFTPLNLYSS